MPKNFFIKKNSRGFTFIELVIVVAIMALIFTLGTASLRQYQRKQFLDKVVREFVSDLNYARSMALSGKKPGDPWCHPEDGFDAYEFKIKKQNTSIEAYGYGPYCDGMGPKCNMHPGNPGQNCQKYVSFNDIDTAIALTFSPPSNNLDINIHFKTLGQGIETCDVNGLNCNPVAPRQIILTYGGFSKRINISLEGNIIVN